MDALLEKYYTVDGLDASALIDGLTEFKNEFQDIRANIESIKISHPLADDEKPRVAVEYYLLDDEDIANNKIFLSEAKEEYISQDKTSVFIDEEQLQYAQIFNSPDELDKLSSIPKLLQNVIDYLKTKPNNKVLDIMYIDYINSDALHVPSIRIYSTQH